MTASQLLDTLGVRPTPVTADGVGGLRQHAPYDRIIVTCSVPAVPWAWAEQLVAGGRLLVDVKVAAEAGNLVLLHRYPDRLEGWFTTRWASFMTMRHYTDHPHQLRQPRLSPPGGAPRPPHPIPGTATESGGYSPNFTDLRPVLH